MNNPVQLDKHYTESELVALYELQNPRGEDYDFYLNLAKQLSAKNIVDVGCGTGQLAREYSACGYEVTGVDPADAMLAYALQRSGASEITWIHGDASALPEHSFDLAVMTGNVAQIFLAEQDWIRTLTAIRRSLNAGGYVAFESRNPEARAWDDWTPEQTRTIVDTSLGEVESWLQLVSAAHGIVRFVMHCRISSSSKYHQVESELRFRTKAEISDSLTNCGLQVDRIYGDWHGGPLTRQSRCMVFVAQKNHS